MRKNRLAMIVIISLCLLVGCGQKSEADVSTIIVEKDGQITGIVIEDFSEPYYEELQAKEMIEKEVSAYNKSEEEEKIKVESFTVENNIAKLTLHYDSAEDYNKFNGETFFVGTIEEAVKQGYDLKVTLVDQADAEKATELSETELLELKDHKLIISEVPMRIRTSQKIKYFNPEGTLVNQKELDAFNVEGLSYIVF